MIDSLLTASGAHAALAGYRKQFLYTLHRALSVSTPVRLEGREDLDILDANNEIVEVIQVKAIERDLTLTHILSFLERTARLLAEKPVLRAGLVSFGPIGPQLRGAWDRDGQDRATVRQKLLAGGLSADQADRLFTSVQFEPVSEHDIEVEVRAQLQQLATAADIDASFDLLMLWIYAGAERSLVVDRAALRDRLDRVGRYVVERSFIAREWFTNIVHLSAPELSRGDEIELEYREGVSARFEHIIAELDVERPGLMGEVDRAFERAHIVVIRGASGQGKSTLAYRWLHERVLGIARFELREVRDRQHARELAAAIAAYLRATDIEMTLLHDVRPGDTDWTELLRELAPLPNIRLLITIREDDWRRATIDIPHISFAEVELELGEAEARELHDRLAGRGAIPQFHDFSDAWARFGGGPLLEFVYLLTQPTSLRERLRQQLERLTDDENSRPGLLRLLRWTATADAFGARLDARATGRLLGLNEPGPVFIRLEREYLLREDGGRLAGVHAVRSQLLVELFTERDAGFATWSDTAVEMLAALLEQDREIFLLHAFSRHADARTPLVDALGALPSRTWAGVRGVARALVWLGVAQLVERNEALVDEVQRGEGTAWYVLLDADVVGLQAATGRPPTDLFASLDSVPAARKDQVAAWRSRLRDVDEVLGHARGWMSRRAFPSGPPTVDADWEAAAEAMFWAGHLGVTLDIDDAWAKALAAVLDRLGVQTLADLNHGAWKLGREGVFADQHGAFVQRFMREFNVLAYHDTGTEISVEYLVTYDWLIDGDDKSGAQQERPEFATFLNEQSVHRCRVLQRLFPEYQKWGARGVGQRFALSAVNVTLDISAKNMPRESLPPPELTQFHGAFYRLGDLRLRAETWPQWCAQVLAHRGAACDGVEILIRAVEGYFRLPQPANLRDSGLFDAPPFTRIIQYLFEGRPLFPRCAVDEWGFISEGVAAKSDPWLDAQKLGLLRHDPLRKSLSDLLQHMRFFLQQARHAIEVQPEMAVAATDAQRQFVQTSARQSDVNPNSPRLSLHNLASAWKRLPEVQRLFRASFLHHVDAEALTHIEERERCVYEQLFAIWCEFVREPHRVQRNNIAQTTLRALREDLRRLRRKISDAFYAHNILSRMGPLRHIRDDFPTSPGLWLVLDAHEPTTLDDVSDQAVRFVAQLLQPESHNERRSLLIQNSWESIHIISLLRGRLLGPNCISVSSIALMKLGPDCIRSPEEIPAEVTTTLALEYWDHSLLRTARLYLQLCLCLRTMFAHHNELADYEYLTRIPDYAEHLEREFEQSVQALQDIHAELLGTLAEITRQPGFQSHALLDGVAEALTAPLDGDGDGYAQVGRLLRVPNPETVWMRTLEIVTAMG